MKTEVERLEKNEVVLNVEIPAEDFAGAIEGATKKVASKIAIPGFRKGKVPKEIVEQRVGKDYIVEEAVRDSIPYFYVAAVAESGIAPVDQPKIDVKTAQEGQPLVFTAKVTVKPDVKLGKYEGIEVDRPLDVPTEADIDQQIAVTQEHLGKLEVSASDKVEKGDFVVIDFKGYVDDEPIDGGVADDYLLEIGAGTFVPGIEDQLMGVTRGETKEVWVDIPEEYHVEQIAGKRVKFDIAVKEIKRKTLPPADDEFAKQVGYESLEHFKNDLRERIGGAKKKTSDVAVRNELILKVTEGAELDLPPVMVDNKLDEMVADFARNLQSRGLSLDQYLESSEKTLADLRDALREEAEFQVKSGLVLEAIAKAEGLEPTEEEVDTEVKTIAESIQQDPQEFKARITEAGTIDLVVEQVMVRKTLEKLVEKANIKPKVETEKEKEGKEKKPKATKKTGGAKSTKQETGKPEGEPAQSEKRDGE